jgi:hypothetical protein
MEWLPCDVTRTVPCYARLFILEANATPAGPVRMAALLAGGRYQMQPRNIVVEGVVDGPDEAVHAAFGSALTAGRVDLTRDGQQVTATVGRDNKQLVTVQLPALRALDSGMLRWDGWMAAGGPQLVECAVNPEVTRAFLAKDARLETAPGLDRADVWRRFRNLNVISACYAEGTFVFGEREALEPLG